MSEDADTALHWPSAMAQVPVALPTTAKARKDTPLVSGCLDYFPAALAAVARLSKVGNDQHNPGQPMHWARGKSNDHADCIVRHLTDRGTTDTDGVRHSTKVAWRALALLQEELELAGAPTARGAVVHTAPPPVALDLRPLCVESRREVWSACEDRDGRRCAHPCGLRIDCAIGDEHCPKAPK
jgi:hypothetical protein